MVRFMFMVDVGKSYGAAIDVGIPRVTREMAIRAVRVTYAAALDVADARLLSEALGFDLDLLMEARRL
jgi:hypothetical protein